MAGHLRRSEVLSARWVVEVVEVVVSVEGMRWTPEALRGALCEVI